MSADIFLGNVIWIVGSTAIVEYLHRVRSICLWDSEAVEALTYAEEVN